MTWVSNNQEGMKNMIDSRNFNLDKLYSLSSIVRKIYKKDVIHRYRGVADENLKYALSGIC